MKEKKTIIILILVLTIGIVGLTIAYFANSSSVDNVFTTQPNGTTVTENFTSPSNWLPGDITPKTVVATNSGNVDEAVRISLSESWVTANGSTLNGWITENGNKSSHLPENEPSTDERVAVINFDNTSDWTYSNGYYYYNYKLSPNEETSSLIKSVTFNSKTKLDDTCVETPTSTGRTITCNSSGDDYDNATYTLTFNIETVQYNKYKEAWGTELAIAEEKVRAYKIGDEITFDNAKYYVLYDSGVDKDYVTLLKANVLTANEVNQFSTNYTSTNGEYPYYIGNYYSENMYYNISSIKNLVDNWSHKYRNDLVSINGYKARLISRDDLIDSLGYEINGNATYLTSNSSENTPEWAVINGKKYWSMDFTDDKNWYVQLGISDVIDSEYGGNLYVRPVINLKKSAIGKLYENETVEPENPEEPVIACDINDFNHIVYSIGDLVSYNNANYYVIVNSSADQNYVTLLKSDLLSYNELSSNKGSIDSSYLDSDSGIGLVSYYSSESCNSGDYSGCTNNYSESLVKVILNNWIENINSDNLIEINGYKVRLLNENDLFDNLGYDRNVTATQYIYKKTDDVPEFMYNNSNKYWMMSSSGDNSHIDVMERNIVWTSSNYVENRVYNKYAIRPVINLKKCAISD